MKKWKFLLEFSLALGLIFTPVVPANSQSGTQSDITVPQEPVPILPPQEPVQQEPVPILPSQEASPGGEVGGQLIIDRSGYETLVQGSDFETGVQLLEEYQAVTFSQYLGIDLKGKAPSVDEIGEKLCALWREQGQKPAFIYVSSQSTQLDLFTIFPKCSRELEQAKFTTRKTSPEPSREKVLQQAELMYGEIANEGRDYIEPAQQLYTWMVSPIETELKANEINVLIFSMDSGLRTLPIAALYDGEKFLGQKYSLAIVPSFGLTDISYYDLRQSPILAMGAAQFSEQLPIKEPLPSVPIELQNIVREPWQGNVFLNERFTIENFIAQNQQQKFGIVHLATHGRFKQGSLNDSFIQFYDRSLSLPEFRQIANNLKWTANNTTLLELLVLSACETAFGSENAELGFAGLAVLSGVKSVMASLWEVSDAGTLALMSEFYQQLSQTPIKAKALQQTQKALLEGSVRIEDGYIRLSNGTLVPLPPELGKQTAIDLSHPFVWSAFTLIGNWN